MSTAATFLQRDQRLPGLAATIAVHLALVCLWQVSHQPQSGSQSDAKRIQWINIAPPKILRPPPPAPAIARPARTPLKRVAPPALPRQEPEAVTLPQASPEEPAPATTSAPAAAPAPSAYDILAQARKDLGAIDKDLRKQFPGPKIAAPPDSPQIRLQKGIEYAAEMAPPSWYEKAKVTELVVPGGGGKRRYRIITAQGTFCVTYESNNSLNGPDPFANARKPTYSTCPEHEQAATKQKY